MVKISARDVKVKNILLLEDNQYGIVIKVRHDVTHGKRGNSSWIEVRKNNGNKEGQRYNSDTILQKVITQSRKCKFIYQDREDYHFIDEEGNLLSLTQNIIGPQHKFLSPKEDITVIMSGDTIIKLEFPLQEVEVLQTTEGNREASSGPKSKSVVITGNIVIKGVPAYIKQGDKIIIDITTMEFLKRV